MGVEELRRVEDPGKAEASKAKTDLLGLGGGEEKSSISLKLLWYLEIEQRKKVVKILFFPERLWYMKAIKTAR